MGFDSWSSSTRNQSSIFRFGGEKKELKLFKVEERKMSVQFPVVLAPMENRLSRGLAVLVYLLLLGVTNPYTFKVRNIELIGLGSSLACGN